MTLRHDFYNESWYDCQFKYVEWLSAKDLCLDFTTIHIVVVAELRADVLVRDTARGLSEFSFLLSACPHPAAYIFPRVDLLL
jgi:hypothetical protein